MEVNAIEVNQYPSVDEIKKIHDICHFGVDRTSELLREKYGSNAIKSDQVKEVIKQCVECSKICPAPRIEYRHGQLSTDKVWYQLYSDVTYFNGVAYLTIVDSATRFCIWRKLRSESAEEKVGI